MFELQRLAAEIVGGVLSGRSLDAQLRSASSAAAGLSTADRAAVQAITYGTLRLLGEIDGVIDLLLKRPLEHQRVRDLLRIAVYQLAYTRAAPYAIVDHAVRACVLLRLDAAKGLVNAVLRRFSREREALLQQARRTETGAYSHPAWWIEKLRVQYPEHYTAMLSNANEHPPLTVRINQRRTTVEDYLGRLARAEITARVLGGPAVVIEHPIPVAELPGFDEGDVSVQDAAAQEAVGYLDLRAGQRVLDACAAPGGKTAHILESADVELTAADNDAQRLQRIESNLKRLQLKARVVRADVSQPREWWDGVPFARILADVPCSASGVVRRHPDIKWLRRPSDIARFAERQHTILNALWQLLETDGKLLYVTCSVFHEENGAQIDEFLERHHDARRLSLPGPHTNAHGLAGQILPDETHDGFFYALLQKS
jgi:16S rRNA (cytosine967-C5)-methyltransferase